MSPQEILEAIADLENLISYQISMLAYNASVEIKEIKIKQENIDSVFNNDNKKSFIVEIIIK